MYGIIYNGGSLATHSIAYIADNVHLRGAMAGAGPDARDRPGVMIVHGGAGLDAHAHQRARQFADLGYVTFACDMYGEAIAGDRARIMATINELRSDRDRLCVRAQAGIDVLSAACDGRIAVVGYCFGGMAALEMARAGIEVAACVSVHGALATNRPAAPGALRTKVFVCHGALDPYCPPAHVAGFVDEMNHAESDWQLVVYGGAMHGFTHHDATGQTPGVLYDPIADARSSAAISAFLRECLPA
jgi:dienelactone hydrolase